MSATQDSQWSAALIKFRDAANAFIEAVDRASSTECGELFTRLNFLLPELYSAALALPVVAPDSADIETSQLDTDAWSTVFKSLQEKFGSRDLYWTVFDSTEKAEPLQGSLADDISEIYMDLKSDLALCDRKPLSADLLWSIRFSFTSHWGRHLTSALKVIYDSHVS